MIWVDGFIAFLVSAWALFYREDDEQMLGVVAIVCFCVMNMIALWCRVG